MRHFARFVCLSALLLAAASPCLAEKRIALVIGNAAYRFADELRNPRNDADDVSASLRRVGFETIVGRDLDKAGMDEITIRFARAARDADVALFYYSGHAMQFNGVNYLMPVDAKLSDEADLRLMSRVDEIVADLQQARNLRILVLDSCRNNPLADELRRSLGLTRSAPLQRGLARIDTPRGMIVAYATQSGQTADDGSGRNSPYTAAFLRHIEASEEIGTVFRRVSADVYDATSRKQLPELSLSLIGEFYLRGRSAPPQPPSADAAAAAAQAWTAGVKDTTSVAVLSDFVRRFGDTIYGSLARERLEQLAKQQPPPSPPKPQAPPTPKLTFVAPPTSPPVPAAGPCGSASVLASLSNRSPTPMSPAEECAARPRDAFKECPDCPEMVVIPTGAAMIGAPAGEEGRRRDDASPRRIAISRPFAVGRYSVTFEEWDACVADGGCGGHRPSDQGWGRGRRPVINVSWHDARAYVAWLSRKTGKPYRLLSEAEREYVTRAGTMTPFWWGSSISSSQANYNGSYSYGRGPKGENLRRTVPVDAFQPNPWGLYQVHGNVWDWVEDCHRDGEAEVPSDGSARQWAGCGARVLRGGSWINSPNYLRAASRIGYPAEYRDRSLGFRVARSLDR